MLFGATDVFNGFHLALLDPATGATKKAFGEHYFSLAIAGRSVWVVQGRGEIESGSGRPFVEQIDPSTFHVVRREALPRSDGSARMAASGDDLWVVTYQGELAHFNGLTGERLGDVLHLGLTADDVAASEGAAWVLDKQRGRVVRIDGATSAVSTVDLSGAPTKIAAGQDGAWVIDNLANTATLIDPSGTRVLSTVGVGGEPTDIAVGLDAVWVADAGTHALYRIDPITHEVRPFNVRGPVHYLALDEQAGTIWLSAQECPPGRCL